MMKINFKKIPLFVAKNAIYFSLLLLLIALIIGISVFYKCSVLATKIELKKLDNECPLNENDYNKVLETWEKHEKMFNEADSKHYYDLFSGGIID